jgi:hypothetical protein
MEKTTKTALLSLLSNIAFAGYHLIFGVVTASWWLFTVGVYYTVLSIMRFVVIRVKKNEQRLAKITGGMLMALSVPLVGTVILSVVRDRGHKLHMIIMIAMAAYAFTRITLAIINLAKARKSPSTKLITLRNISFASACVSIFALQRSMLVSFEGMTETEIRIMNAATGSAVCILVFLLGLSLLIFQRYPKTENDQNQNKD